MNEQLLAARLEKGWSQEEAAQIIGVAPRTYQRWEQGGTLPNFSSRRMLRQAFAASDEALGVALRRKETGQPEVLRKGPSSPAAVIAPQKAVSKRNETIPPLEPYLTAPTSDDSSGDVPAQKAESNFHQHMIQYGQEQQASEQNPAVPVLRIEEAFVPSESEVLSPLGLSIQALSPEIATVDPATWFGAKVNDLKAYGAFWAEPAASCQQQQRSIYTELTKWNVMADQDHEVTNEYLISRRMALATLATLSSSLLAKVQLGPLTTFVIEEFLAQCATSITTCWDLLQGRELTIVQQALTRYLPILRSWAKQPSSYQQTSAYLASQGCLLMGILSLHSLSVPQNFQKRILYCTQATEYAHLSADPGLQITALTHLANAHYDMGQLDNMLQTYQKAVSTLEDLSKQHQFPALLRSKLQVELAHAYAQHGQVQQSLGALEEARVLFPSEHEEAPVFLSTDYGYHSLVLFEGLTHLDLEKHAPGDHHSLQAANALARIESVSISEHIPERFRVEIINQQALAAIREGNLDNFRRYLLEGAQGAKELGSEKRRQETIANWKAARVQWPHEKRVLELADVLF